MTLTVVAYNFLSGGSHQRSGHWSRLVRDLDADLVFAQECRPPRACPGESYRLFPDDGWIWAPAGSEETAISGGDWFCAFCSGTRTETP